MIELRKMNEAEYTSYLNKALPGYAEEKMKGEGLSKPDALKLATDTYAKLLPNGLNTENQFLFTVIDSEKPIGVLWFAKRTEGSKEYAFIFDIILNEDVRGKGLSKTVLSLAESEVRKIGLNSVGLHVFGHNKVAINLYKKTGFRTTNRIMVKDL